MATATLPAPAPRRLHDPLARVALARMRRHPGRLVASGLAVVIAVAFVVATLTLTASSRAAVLAAVGAPYVHSDLVVQTPGYDPETGEERTIVPAAVPALGALTGVAQVVADRSTYVQARGEDAAGDSWTRVDALTPAGPLRAERVSAGRLPEAPDEVAVSDRVGVGIGTTMVVTSYPPVDPTGTTGTTGTDGTDGTTPPDPEPVRTPVRVVGLLDLAGDPSAGVSGRLVALPEVLGPWGAAAPTQLRIALVPGADPGAVRAEVADLVRADPDARVLTGTAAAEEAAAGYSGSAAELGTVLLAFAAISVLVAGLVIANTFAVLIAQRTRELALLRAVGANRSQVARGVLVEALVCGVLASLVGIAAGVGLSAVVSGVLAGIDSPIPLGGLVVPGSAVLAGILVGTGVTLVSALVPARSATRIAPLAALRPALVPLGARPNRVRAVLGWLVFVPSTGLMLVCAGSGRFLEAVAAGAVSFLGFLLLAQSLVPWVVGRLGRWVAPLGGVPGRLAAGNAVRNPRRTAATATALLIGVTLTTAMVVGAQSTRTTAAAGLAAAYPTDVVVSASEDVPPAAREQLAGLDGVAALTPVTVLDLPDGTRLLGLDPAGAAAVVRSQDRSPLPTAGEVVVGGEEAAGRGLSDGTTLSTTDAAGSALSTGLRIRLAPDSHLGMTATTADVAALAGREGLPAPASQLWIRLADDLSPAEESRVVEAITRTTTDLLPSSDVAGVVTERTALDQLVKTMLLIVTGLLAVAVLIALIGVGNTLALSVIERRQESGLLRALGLTRRQLRSTLAWEAALVAGVAGLLGAALGTGYGLAGTQAVLGQAGDVVVDVPWLQVLAVVVVSGLAGALASVLPARHAARTPPVAAIAD
ncbi:ABC transporter permease [Kineococcus gynurae]|uniref:ABC transporter permease n=1 Tax=Kineococcus gynurae TaxID=452979 RepID=A0ABV5LVW2_9ACTN